MEKQLFTLAYWSGVFCTVLALITRALALIGVWVLPVATAGKVPLSYKSFLDGAILFFVMAITISVGMWIKAQKA